MHIQYSLSGHHEIVQPGRVSRDICPVRPKPWPPQVHAGVNSLERRQSTDVENIFSFNKYQRKKCDIKKKENEGQKICCHIIKNTERAEKEDLLFDLMFVDAC